MNRVGRRVFAVVSDAVAAVHKAADVPEIDLQLRKLAESFEGVGPPAVKVQRADQFPVICPSDNASTAALIAVST